MGTVAQSSSNMQGLLVLASLAVASAQVLPLGYHGLGLGYASIVHPYAANIVKPVVKEIEVPVETIKFEVAETGCKNSSATQCPAPGGRDRLRTLWRLVPKLLLLPRPLLPPLLLLCCLSDTDTDWVTTVSDTPL